jgi:prophage antirepressor-like protein
MKTNDTSLVGLGNFDGHTIRQYWDEDEWYFSVIDVVEVLTESVEPSKYWSAMKTRVKRDSGFELSTICRRLKLPADDGKLRETDCANTENMLHIVQYIPSKKAVPFRQWLAKAGAEKLESFDPEAELEEWKERAIRSYMAQGYSLEWATSRVTSIIARNALTGEWSVRGIKEEEYPILTSQLHMGIFGITIEEHKGVKNFPITRKGKKIIHKGDLPPAMTATELALNALGSTVSRDLHITNDSHGFAQISVDVDEAGRIVGNTRREIEKATGRPVVSSRNLINEPDGMGLFAPLEDRTEEKE